MRVTAHDVWKARRRIKKYVTTTPLLNSDMLSKKFGAEIWMKMENLQLTGSFKVRGAVNTLLTLTESERARGVIAASAGNHAQGVCYAARLLGVSALIVVPKTAPQTKQEGIVRLGGELVVYGDTYDEAERYSYDLSRETNRVLIHGFESAPIIAGQGTVALEIFDERPDLDTLLVPAGGGGLICGVALAAKAIYPGIRIIGVQSEASPPWYHAFRAGRPVEVEYRQSIADGLHGGIGRENFEMAKRLVDDFILVSESDIMAAMAWMATYHHYMIEGSAAVTIAALQSQSYLCEPNEKVACVISGGNVDAQTLGRLLFAERTIERGTRHAD